MSVNPVAQAGRREIEFSVRGVPVPQGSMAKGRFGPIRHANAGKLEDWRHAIGDECRRAMGRSPSFGGAVRVYVTFLVRRPASHLLRSGGLRPSAPAWPTGRPDVDKLARAALDAMTAVAFDDDSQVVELVASKLYADDDPVGAYFRIVALS